MLFSRIALIGLLSLLSSFVLALDPPQSRVVLTVTGKITHTNSDNAAQFDMGMLASMPKVNVTTATSWHDGGPHTFTGVDAKALFDAVGIQGSNLRITALNDYMTDVPVSDFLDQGAILATHIDGQPMSVRDKGPMMVIYPFDDNPTLKNEKYYGRSIWQIKTIQVKE